MDHRAGLIKEQTRGKKGFNLSSYNCRETNEVTSDYLWLYYLWYYNLAPVPQKIRHRIWESKESNSIKEQQREKKEFNILATTASS